MKLKDKTVIITGASSGLGEALAYKAAEEGAKIALVSRSESRLQKVKQRIIKNKGQAEYFVCDIKDLNEVKKTVKDILQKFKVINIVVNNAGIWTDESLEANNHQLRKEALETNILGNIQFIYEILPILKKQNHGYIFNVISTSGDIMSPSSNNTLWKTYGATKWAMTGFTKALIDELKETKIKVTSFHPGGFDSNLYEKAGRLNPHNQLWMMKTEDVADIIVFALTRPDDVLMERIVVTKKI